jgi:hypothetical protein
LSTEQAPVGAALRVANAAPGEWNPTVAHEEVTLEPAKRAVACGATGCKRTEKLLLTRIQNFGKRVLCPIHALVLIEREIGSDEEESK